MNYKILNISALLGVSMLSAAASSKNPWNRAELTRVQASRPQQALAAQPALAVVQAAQPQQTPVMPEDILKGSYPKEWNNYLLKDMFAILNKNPNESVNPSLLKEWIHAIYACFNDFDKDRIKFKAINYARTIHTLATYAQDYKNPESDTLINALLAEWSKRAPVQLFSEQNIANSLWAFAKLDKQAPDALLQAITDENIGDFNAQGIANSLWALATLGQQVPDALLQSITDEKIHTFNAQGIANSLWAFAKRDKQAPDALLQAFTDENISDFNPQNIINSLWAFATLGQQAPDALLQAFTDKNIGNFNAQGIANSLWAFAKLGRQAPNALLQAITDEKIRDFKPQEIANTLWAFATLGQQAPNALLQAITDANIHKFKAQEIANSLWALAVMNYANKPLIDALFERVPHEGHKLEGLHQIYLASQHYKVAFDIDLEPFKIRQQIVSQSEQRIFNALIKDYPKLNPQYFIDEIASYADLYIEINNQKLVIFIDGPKHYDSAGQLKASDAFLNRLLEKYGYNVQRVKLTILENDIQTVKEIIESLTPKAQTPKKKR
ncbi:MAG: hypothetical protein NEHIOOID_00959 [Holosporales bacterium]